MKDYECSTSTSTEEYLIHNLSKLQITRKRIRKLERPRKLMMSSRKVKATSNQGTVNEGGEFYGVALKQSPLQLINCSRVLL